MTTDATLTSKGQTTIPRKFATPSVCNRGSDDLHADARPHRGDAG
jgi:hypothetical protein